MKNDRLTDKKEKSLSQTFMATKKEKITCIFLEKDTTN